MDIQIQGQLIQILPLNSGVGKASGKEWKKQEYILETQDQYPRKIHFSVWGDRIDPSYQVGDQVTVWVDIESREFNGRWYTDVKAWRMERGYIGQQVQQQMPQEMPAASAPAFPTQQPSIPSQPATGWASNADAGDDLPF
ncbi:DUF3127 domain-containing protein [Porphyromonas gulae]|uniref:DUF3127 domain-containing protein n=1 Tax=Porphyromonas gulae TaxID=111105 RepID=UPI0006900A53|nr:DUF3127 domain-containing protein [Porphyromonas gulae]